MSWRPHPARHINEVLDQALATFDQSVVVLAGDREFHQQEAMSAARMIRYQYSAPAKEKARKDCVSHLRASLSRPAATGGRQAVNPEASL